MFQFGTKKFRRTFRNSFGQFVWTKKKSHYNVTFHFMNRRLKTTDGVIVSVCIRTNVVGSKIMTVDPVTRILARLPRCMGMLAKILARSCQDLTKATMIMQDHGKADHASYQAYQDFPCILPSFSMCLAKHTKIFLSILPIQPGFFHAFCKAFQDFRCNLQSLIRSTCVFEPFEILY